MHDTDDGAGADETESLFERLLAKTRSTAYEAAGAGADADADVEADVEGLDVGGEGEARVGCEGEREDAAAELARTQALLAELAAERSQIAAELASERAAHTANDANGAWDARFEISGRAERPDARFEVSGRAERPDARFEISGRADWAPSPSAWAECEDERDMDC
jgi:hypothetical protein